MGNLSRCNYRAAVTRSFVSLGLSIFLWINLAGHAEVEAGLFGRSPYPYPSGRGNTTEPRPSLFAIQWFKIAKLLTRLPVCWGNEHCPSDRTCSTLMCQDPCTDYCGVGATCQVQSHSPCCTCSDGRMIGPHEPCYPMSIDPDLSWMIPCPVEAGGTNIDCQPGVGPVGPVSDCHSDEQCPPYLACMEGACHDPCSRATCSQPIECTVTNHQAVCSVPAVTIGTQVMVPSPESNRHCSLNDQCPNNEVCSNGICRELCFIACTQRPNYNGNHQIPNCLCPDRIPYGNKLGTPNSYLSVNSGGCVAGRCRDPCFIACTQGPNYNNNRPIPNCRCPVRTPYGYGFGSRDGYPNGSCNVNDECPDDKVCIGRICCNPCPGDCSPTMSCIVYDHKPTYQGPQYRDPRSILAANLRQPSEGDTTEISDEN